MREFNDGLKQAIGEIRIRVAETAFNHVTTAIGLFESYAYSQACFLAITAIEEMGKARTLQIVASNSKFDEEPEEIDAKGIERFLREHRLKAIRAASSGLSVNHAAVRRHGRHEEADLNITSGVQFLAKSGQWMNLRNACIYSDVDLHSKVVSWPGDEISGHHAYYFICMALEVLAKESDAGFGGPLEEIETDPKMTEIQTASEFEDQMIGLLEQFMVKYEDEFDESKLEFFTKHPQYDNYREEIRENEVRVDEQRRGTLKEVMRNIVDEGDEPTEEDKEILPEGVTHEQFQEMILDDMVDIGMDLPFFTEPGLHPDLEELHQRVDEYLVYESN